MLLVAVSVVLTMMRMVMVMTVEQTWPLEEDLYPTSRMNKTASETMTTFCCNYSRYVLCAQCGTTLLGLFGNLSFQFANVLSQRAALTLHFPSRLPSWS